MIKNMLLLLFHCDFNRAKRHENHLIEVQKYNESFSIFFYI